jgi:uncharacterized SAM-binding protein YcdF (DUF218 family)
MKKLIFCIVILITGYLFHEAILNKVGQALVRKDDIKPSDALVVLTGDYTGTRMQAGISLLKKQMGKYIIFNGGKTYWKINHSELVLRQLSAAGISSEKAVWSDDQNAQSTREEAVVNIRLLKEKGAKSFILITSDYHTARSARVYEKLIHHQGLEMVVYPVQDPTVKLNGWWKDRSSAKNVLLEFEKTIWYFLNPSDIPKKAAEAPTVPLPN